MAKESMLTEAEKEAIRIDKFIFHIIIKDNAVPRYLNSVDISGEQRTFFRLRLAEAAQGRQYVFNVGSPLKDLATQILAADNDRFVELSRTIAANFQATHSSSTNDGVFIIATASTLNNRNLLFLVKLDHKKIYQYHVEDNRALLQEVQDTFSEDKTAIQKVALIDVNERVVWDVLVFDRGSRADKGNITDYFKRFLGAEARETESDLTRKALSIVNLWATQNKSLLDPSQGIAKYKKRGKDYLLNHDEFDTNAFVESVIQDENVVRRQTLKESFLSYMNENGLAHQNFSIKKSAINRSLTKNIRQTAEGVKIEWEGTEQDGKIDIPNQPDENGEYLIKIRTSNIISIQ